MSITELDNPIWASLSSRHYQIAQGLGDVVRFPADYAPFLGVADGDVNPVNAFKSLIGDAESVYLLGVAPQLPSEYQLETFRPLAQMICEEMLQVIEGPAIIPLAEHHRADVLALTARVYPHYFRTRTMDMGRYFGIYQEGRLAAMIGERLGTESHQEMSAICTDPDFTGRGYARRLLAFLNNDTLEKNRTPYLHVSFENTRAFSMYQAMGYRVRREIPFWSLRRTLTST